VCIKDPGTCKGDRAGSQRRQEAINAGRIKEDGRKEILFRKFDILKDQNDEEK